MSNSNPNEDALRDMSREEIMSALFAHMVMQNTNMALMFLGKTPHPQSGETVHDLEAARIFIDQLEMLEFKTKGNLSREEEKLLQQSLMHLRMSFVESVEKPPPQNTASPKTDTAPAAQATPETPIVEPDTRDEESRKRFSKKF